MIFEFPLLDYFEDIELFEEALNLAFIGGENEQQENEDEIEEM